ncbi:carbohydrate ABC transporter permease [Paenibacillus sp. BC26]|uniref:carbohydrate ABC transporter permease n=1 Tax=Paenibacillus sp. BC26 TaxID=1881032 RepID=UPI0008EDE55D|nr:carbohydrate ABC transporter permease [Paenibacillus sp. BC26]SFS46788.1 carbohydrate ABC transporter membrane protein 2, CUT1 family [Paenibacillus sp. BC26]
MSGLRRSLPGNVFYYAMFALIFVIVFVPIALVVFGAFKTRTELFQTTPLALPGSFLNFSNFKLAYTQGDMLRGLWNTTIIAFITLCGNAILGTMTAYILNRFQFKLKKVVYGLFLIAMIIPAYTTEIARFQIIHSIGMYDSLRAPILIYIGTDIMQIYIYMQFLEKISNQLDESAMLDGATYVRIFRSIIFPLLLPATATLAILKSVTVMNDVYIPFLYMPSKELVTMSTALMKFVGARGSDLSALCAGIVLVLIPSAAVYIAFQRFIFKGLMDGAVKG